jgi:hypothetical protein
VHVFAIDLLHHATSSAEERKREEQQTQGETLGEVVITSTTSQIVCKNPKSMFSFLKLFRPSYFTGEYSFAQLRIQDVHSYCTTYD